MAKLRVFAEALSARYAQPRTQAKKTQTRYTYTDGPMTFLAQQVVRAMQDAGHPAKIHTVYRSPEVQRKKKAQGFSRADPYKSPHQFFEAADIVHESFAWFDRSLKPADMPLSAWYAAEKDFWVTLARCIRVVGQKYGVVFDGGYNWGWDYAHFELKDWRDFRSLVGENVPDDQQLALRFEQVLPAVWKQYQARKSR